MRQIRKRAESETRVVAGVSHRGTSARVSGSQLLQPGRHKGRADSLTLHVGPNGDWVRHAPIAHRVADPSLRSGNVSNDPALGDGHE